MALKKKIVKKPAAKKPTVKKPEVKKTAPVAKAEIGHNSGPRDVNGIVGKRLRALIDRIHRLEDERKGLGEDIKDVYTEAKGVGFSVKTIRAIVKIERADRDKLKEEKELLNLYLLALDPELAEVLS